MKERESTIDSPLIITEEQKNKATKESADSTVSFSSTVEFRLKRGVFSFSNFTMAVIVVKGKGAEGQNQKVSLTTSFFDIDSTEIEKTFS